MIRIQCFLTGLATLTLALAAPVFANAQKGAARAAIRTNGSLYSKEFKPMELGAEVDYYFTDDLHAGISLETAVGLFDRSGARDYSINGTYGIDAGYRFWKFGSGSLDGSLGMGNVMADKDWKYLYYDANVRLNVGRQDTQPFVGIGLRYYDARGDVFDNYLRCYLSLGVSFGL